MTHDPARCGFTVFNGQLLPMVPVYEGAAADGVVIVTAEQMARQLGRPVEELVKLWHELAAEQRAQKVESKIH